MGNQAGSYSYYAKLSFDDFKRRYHNLSDYDSLLQKNVHLFQISDDQFEQQLRLYSELQQKKPDWFSPVIAWTIDPQSHTIYYTTEMVQNISELPSDITIKGILRQFFSLWSVATFTIQFINIGFVKISQKCFLKGHFYLENKEDFIKNSLFQLFKVEKESQLSEEFIKLYANGVGLEIWKQLNSYFSNLTSPENAILSIQKLISNNEKQITEATQQRKESIGFAIINFLDFAELYLFVSSDRINARDHQMNVYKNIEMMILAADIWNDRLLLIATPKGELKMFNRELKEMRVIDLEGLKVNEIKLMKRQIFVVGRVRQFGHEYSGYKVIECNDELAVQNIKTTIAKPGQLVMAIINNGKRFMSVSQMNILQLWKVGKDLQLIEEIKGQVDVVSAIIQLSNGRILTGGNEGHLILWNEEYQKISEAYCTSGISMILEQTDWLVLIGHIDGLISIWDLKQGLKMIYSFKAHEMQISSMELKITRENRQLITSSWDGDVSWWNV